MDACPRRMQVFFKCRTDGKDERDEQKEHKMNLFDSFKRCGPQRNMPSDGRMSYLPAGSGNYGSSSPPSDTICTRRRTKN